MRNGNVYKKFCAIMISLGLFLSVGQYSYAHSPELKEAETNAKANPTIENLERLYNLYKRDEEYHKSRREYDEAQKSEIGAAWARARKSEKIAANNKTLENLENAAKCWDKATALCEESGDTTNATKAKSLAAWSRARHAQITAENDDTPENFESAAKRWDKAAALKKEAGNSTGAVEAKANAAWDRACKANTIAENDNTPENLENAAKRWDNAAALYEEAWGSKNAAWAKANAAWARAQKAEKIAANNRTQDNLENVVKCWDEAAALKEETGNVTAAARARAFASWARARKASEIAENDDTSENWEKAAKCYDEAVTLHEVSGYITAAAGAKASAAWARARKASAIAENKETSENWENEAKRWDEAAALHEQAGYATDATNAKAFSALARAKQAELIANHDPTVKNYQNAVDCWDKAAELCTEAGDIDSTSTARNNAVQARIGLAKSIENKKLFKLMIGLILADQKN